MWKCSFKSLNGTSCHIDIYKRGYTGSTVIDNLKGADDPFYFEENNSSDLLNDVLRYRTGYIRLIEEYSYGFLSDIYPTEAFDRYVEVYYGSTIIFNGYIQVQDFSNTLVPTPRVIEIPVISPLGLMDKRKFSNTTYLPPSSISLGALLDIALAIDYQYIYVPHNYGYPNPINLLFEVSTLVISPWNEDYHYSMNQASYTKVMKGQTYSYIIEAICKAFGWICHDTPAGLVFSAFDHYNVYGGYYDCFPVGHIGDNSYREDAGVSDSASALSSDFTSADSEANETLLHPDTGIEISYEGESGDRDFDFKHTYVPETNAVIIEPSSIPSYDVFPNHVEIFSLCNLIPVPNIGETNLPQSVFTFENDDTLAIGTHAVAWNGKRGVMISIGQYQAGTSLFYLRFYMRKRTGQKYSLSYDLIAKRGATATLGALNSSPDDNMDQYITTSISSSAADYVQVSFNYWWSSAEGSQYPQLPSHSLFFIYNIKLVVCEQGVPYEEYLYKPASDSDFIPDSPNPPVVSSEITMPISLYRLNDHLIGSAVRSSKITTYPYLFQPRKQLRGKFRIDSILSLPHIRKFTYMSKKWRIIAQEFHPWDDEYILTMQSSPIL